MSNPKIVLRIGLGDMVHAVFLKHTDSASTVGVVFQVSQVGVKGRKVICWNVSRTSFHGRARLCSFECLEEDQEVGSYVGSLTLKLVTLS